VPRHGVPRGKAGSAIVAVLATEALVLPASASSAERASEDPAGDRVAAGAPGRGAEPLRATIRVTYSQSENQSSPHAADYTRAFSRKKWHDVPFCEGEIRSDPNLDVKRISAPR
jgi:hypothetical protein